MDHSKSRKIYIVRHAQPDWLMQSSPDHEFPAGDPLITELGELQAECLGKYMKEIRFNGAIYSSPYLRAMRTAEIAARIPGLPVTIDTRIQEIATRGYPNTEGNTLDKLKERFPGLILNDFLQYPWAICGVETSVDVDARVASFIDWLLTETHGDALIFAHGASVLSMTRNLAARCKAELEQKPVWNCSLTGFESDAAGNWSLILYRDVSFMPLNIVTSNEKTYFKWLEESTGI